MALFIGTKQFSTLKESDVVEFSCIQFSVELLSNSNLVCTPIHTLRYFLQIELCGSSVWSKPRYLVCFWCGFVRFFRYFIFQILCRSLKNLEVTNIIILNSWKSDFRLIRLSVIYLQQFYTNHSLMIMMRHYWNLIIRTEQVVSPFEVCSVVTDWNKSLK